MVLFKNQLGKFNGKIVGSLRKNKSIYTFKDTDFTSSG